MNLFEISVLKILDKFKVNRLILAVSGGLDSMVLLEVFSRLKAKRPLQLLVAHVHHGGTNTFRDQAAQFVTAEATARSLESIVLKVVTTSQSEDSLRKARYQKLEELRNTRNFDAIVMAHHAEDLLETRLIRLVRGVGPQGLRSMNILARHRFRPFLEISREELKKYAEGRGLKWVEDPSNRETRYFRNWIRNEWLPSLEKFRAGSTQSLMRSLNNLAAGANSLKMPISERGIDRNRLLALDKPDQMRVLARYMMLKGVSSYRRGQIQEILKRLDTSRTEFRFTCAKQEWHVDAEHIEICSMRSQVES